MKKLQFTAPVILVLLQLGGCASHEQIVQREPLEDIEIKQTEISEPGSLYLASTSLFGDRRASDVGDIVTVTISESASASKEATTTSGRSSSASAGISSFFGLENSPFLTDQHQTIDPENLISADFDNSFSGNGSTSREDSLTASLTTQVIQTYPNGQLKIRGGKEVTVNNEIQTIYLTGIIRSSDISNENTIGSDKVLNARISYTGQGAVSDNQKPGWAMRIIDNLWPF